MAVRATGYKWTCDWCNKPATTKDNALPEDWHLVKTGELYVLEPEHLCSDACWAGIQHADYLAHELAKEVVRMVRRRWGGKDLADVPEASHVGLRFVIDGVVVEEDEEWE